MIQLRSIVFCLYFCLVNPIWIFPHSVRAQQPTEKTQVELKSKPVQKDGKSDEEKLDNDKLYFSFAGSKWSDVIEWLASTADLALHVDDLPKGTFTYSDSNGFTLQEAIDRVNLFLLPEGFTIVRSGRLLSVINLADPKSVKQLDTLARFVTVEQLAKLEDHDMVKCLFTLGELDSAEAVEELAPLNLLKPPSVFSRTNQLLLIDTAGKLKLAHKVLTAFEPDALDNGTIVKSFNLKHVNAEDLLTVARPHLGLATGEMIGIDVSISADILGKNIFVTGVEDKVKLIEGLIKEIDVEEVKEKDEVDILQAHPVAGGNVELVYNVLQTLLANEEIRLSMDKTSQSIVALAPEKIQKDIADTVVELQGSEAEFAVIPLKHIDPYFVISLLEEMLELDDTSSDDSSFSQGFSRGYDPRGGYRGYYPGMFGQQKAEVSVSPPKIDADPAGMKLFVLGTKSQIAKIKKIVEELDVSKSSVSGSDDKIRIIALRGQKAIDAIETAARFWKEENSIIFYPPTEQSEKKIRERVIAGDEKTETPKKLDKPLPNEIGGGRILSKKLNTELPPIQIQITDRGIMLQSDDTNALDKFEEILRTVIGPTETAAATPIIYYLKFAKPDEAIRILAELLDGGDSAQEAESSTLVNGLVLGDTDFFFGSFVTSREGVMTLTYGSTTVVADPRLNRLIAQGTAAELEMVEAYLKIIDKDKSITEIEIYGKSHVIELKNVEANLVASTLREVYFGRVMGGNQTNQRQPQQQRQPNQPQQNRDPRQNDPRQGNDNQNRDRSQGGREGGRPQQPPQPKGGGGRGGGQTSNEPKMTIAVHEPSNSLIITAPDALFQEVEKLAKLIDSKSVQTIEILKVSRPLASDIQQILSGNATTPNSGRTTNSGIPNSNQPLGRPQNTPNSNQRFDRKRTR